ncbi:MAG: hypothetical protein PHQ10_01720 [Dehalococcoidales bacterium]|mgnify:CR=1 FL=1|nr:hypothetical protein [Dehalococcoidales bacterium]MDD5735614.1 hypothetical protein [Methanothrix soehngenii]
MPVRGSRYLIDNTVFIAAFFPESELSDIVHAATCLYTDAILITNDAHFNKIKQAEIIEVWSNTKAIKRLLEGREDDEDR